MDIGQEETLCSKMAAQQGRVRQSVTDDHGLNIININAYSTFGFIAHLTSSYRAASCLIVPGAQYTHTHSDTRTHTHTHASSSAAICDFQSVGI